MIFDAIHDLFPVQILALIFDQFWNPFWLHFGIPLSSNSMFLGDHVFDDLGDGVFIDFDQKWLPKIDARGGGEGRHHFRHFVSPH